MAPSGKPLAIAKALAFSRERLPTAWREALGESEMARETLRAISAHPITPKRIGGDSVILRWGLRWKEVTKRFFFQLERLRN